MCLGEGNDIRHTFSIDNCEIETQQFTCQEKDSDITQQITLTLSRQRKQCSQNIFCQTFFKLVSLLHQMFFIILPAEFVCINNDTFGDGLVDDEAMGPCDENKVGDTTAVCRANGVWEIIRDGCILLPIHNLLQQSEVNLF